jgi:hypothetical protein
MNIFIENTKKCQLNYKTLKFTIHNSLEALLVIPIFLTKPQAKKQSLIKIRKKKNPKKCPRVCPYDKLNPNF